ncbi:MAG: exodeoxyribonuclease VII large subunit [Minisyncoccia bacterium]|jgi:exodeoxyribonuclease VII large subunit
MPAQELLFNEEEKPAKPLSVLDFIALLNDTFRGIEVSIVGEVSKASFPPSGHVYFDLKDESGDGVLHCVVWRTIYENLGIKLEAGMRIVVLGSPDVYAPRGDLSFKVRAMELTGEGVLKKRYEELKKKLAAEGIFAEERKRKIPEYPERIGIVTSRNGAVIHDILNNLGRFGFKVSLVDARVEGPEAAQSLMSAIKKLKNVPLDVLIVARGGGSMEALQAFDNEKLVRALVDFPVPVIAAIGHHQDVPLSALAADVHVSTPTAAANLLNQSWQEASFRVARDTGRISSAFQGVIARAAQALDLSYYMDAVRAMQETVSERMEYAAKRIIASFDNLLRFGTMRLESTGRVIAANDPARNLRLGYAIVRQHGKIVKSAASMPPDSEFNVQFSDGNIAAKAIKDGERRKENEE